MKAKRPVHAIVRLDGDASHVADRVAVKAVYDDRSVALAEVKRLQADARDATYILIPTRYESADRPITPAPSPAALPARSEGLRPEVEETLRALRVAMRYAGRSPRHPLLPGLVAQVAERIVAQALGATPAPDGSQWDLQVDSTRIEVKAVFLEAHPRRAPGVQVRLDAFDLLALVAFSENFDLLGVYRISKDRLQRFLRPQSHDAFIARVTPELLRCAERVQ